MKTCKILIEIFPGMNFLVWMRQAIFLVKDSVIKSFSVASILVLPKSFIMAGFEASQISEIL